MNDALLVLNPRRIPACIQAIRSLDIPICWVSYMPEPDAAQAINNVVACTDFDRYLILADDTTPTQEALDLIQARTEPVVTGYCNLDEDQYADIVNLTTNILPAPPSRGNSYQFLTRQQVETHPAPTMPTTFAGLALTMLNRHVLADHPIQVEPSTGGQMDYDLSYRLAQAHVPLVAAVGAYVHHVKERWCHMDRNPEKRLLIGDRRPAITWTNVPAAA